MEKWPNFFIVGAPRCGTTFLHNYLNQIPGIYMSKVKEPGYFSLSIDPNLKLTKPIRDKKKYLNLFKKVTDEVAIGESSPSYLWDPKAPKFIFETVQDAKIIMILRDPVQRSYSHYLLGLGLGYQTLSFRKAMLKTLNGLDDYSNRIASASFYAESVKRYLEIFKKEQIKIFIFEEFIKDINKSVKEILNFLGVTSEIPDSIKTVTNTIDVSAGRFTKYLIRNRVLRLLVRELVPAEGGPIVRKLFSKKTKKPPLSEEDRKFAEEIYREDAKKLELILGRHLPWPLLRNT